METLSDTTWDVIINGTGISQSLLALALSRSGKKVLHIDPNQYYGGSDAAFSLDEAQEWAEKVNKDEHRSTFKDASIFNPDVSPSSEETVISPKLASSRAYTLSLSPYFLYARSPLMSALVSSKVFRQLEFMAVGSWWIYVPEQPDSKNGELGAEKVFYRVPGNREDVFAATHISMKSKRTLMRLLRHITKPNEDDASNEDEDMSMPLNDYLASKFSVPEELHNPLLSLSLSQLSQQETSAIYAVPRIQRHLSSIGHLGPGFGAVIAKYGGGAEILQAACRASAVGGGVYALDTRINDCLWRNGSEHSEHPLLLKLANEGCVQAKYFFNSNLDTSPKENSTPLVEVARSISVVSATFPSLFPVTVEGAPVSATAVLMFPGDTLGSPQSPPVYLQVHSSDTGECPPQQSVIYCSVALAGPEGQALIESAVDRLIRAEGLPTTVLWSLRYTHRGPLSNGAPQRLVVEDEIHHCYTFPPSSLDLAFEDDTLDLVKEAWKRVVGDEVDDADFMMFNDRDGTSDQ
ncbi:GDP dissociation inhibitor [Penicillium cf. griseofulvum]|uniref:Rab proteins geranylgeranyltransferase n=1 Tax=Penicillium cf. griseofulvum TaxID=2972120 RepID=A0A9W9M9M0_9EURO|nr:GDP dissociation inhibitor [Penicillium cf. griseofulvum]KAJ5445651.1 GDP dissociation inhibitor [Penicillium cf. griseofulvum]